VVRIADWITDAKKQGAGGSVAVLDSRPGRALSLLYRRFLAALGCGAYLTPPSEAASLAILDEMLEEPRGPLGLDLEGTGTILSFGAPVLDGWTTLGPRGRPPMLIQVETQPSRTALSADHWLRIKPGSEAALALGLAHVMVAERRYDRAAADALDERGPYAQLLSQFAPERVAALTGLSPDEIRATAHRFTAAGPAIAVPGMDPGGGPLDPETERCIWGLNFLAGSVGRAGGIVSRRQLPVPRGMEEDEMVAVRGLSEIPDGSIRVLIVDGSPSGLALAPALVRRKLAPDGARVVNLSPFLACLGLQPDLVLPAPAPMEALEEVTGAFDAPASTFALSVPFLDPPADVLEPAELLRRLSGLLSVGQPGGSDLPDLPEMLRHRAAAIHATGRGTVFHGNAGKMVRVPDLKSPTAFWDLLIQGGCWVDERMPPRPLPRFAFLAGPPAALAAAVRAGSLASSTDYPLVLMPFGWKGAAGDGPLPPVLAKLYRESDVRTPGGHALINPETGRELGVRDGGRAALETPGGLLAVRIRFDFAVLPGVVHVATGPAAVSFGDLQRRPGESVSAIGRPTESVLEICRLNEDGTWRLTPARMRKA
jgi:anaerobic selenocysteine-containing dehydrogenase